MKGVDLDSRSPHPQISQKSRKNQAEAVTGAWLLVFSPSKQEAP